MVRQWCVSRASLAACLARVLAVAAAALALEARYAAATPVLVQYVVRVTPPAVPGPNTAAVAISNLTHLPGRAGLRFVAAVAPQAGRRLHSVCVAFAHAAGSATACHAAPNAARTVHQLQVYTHTGPARVTVDAKWAPRLHAGSGGGRGRERAPYGASATQAVHLNTPPRAGVRYADETGALPLVWREPGPALPTSRVAGAAAAAGAGAQGGVASGRAARGHGARGFASQVLIDGDIGSRQPTCARLTNTVFHNARGEFRVFGAPDGDTGARVPDVQLQTTLPKRAAEADAAGWTSERALWSVRTDLRTTVVADGSAVPLECVAHPTVLLNVAYPLHYWHVIAETVLPLAHTIGHLRRTFGDAELLPHVVLAQSWTGRVVPQFADDALQALSLTPLVDTVLGLQAPTCFRHLTVGQFPAILSREDMRRAAALVAQQLGVVRRPGSDQRDARALRLTIVQRRAACYVGTARSEADGGAGPAGDAATSNATGAATRRILNVDELAAAAVRAGFAVHVVELEAMPLAEQVQLASDSDVWVTAHGGAWANTVFLPRDSVAIQLVGYGVHDACAARVPMYRPLRVDAAGGDEALARYHHDFCDTLLHDMPAAAAGSYLEWSPSQAHFIPPFQFADEFCGTHGGNDDDGTAACREREAAAQRRATADPALLWNHRPRELGHRFFKNQDMRVPLRDWLELLHQARGLLTARQAAAAQLSDSGAAEHPGTVVEDATDGGESVEAATAHDGAVTAMGGTEARSGINGEHPMSARAMCDALLAAASDTERQAFPLRVLFVHHLMTHGGVETMIMTLVRALDRRCFTPSVLEFADWAPTKPEEEWEPSTSDSAQPTARRVSLRPASPLAPQLRALGVPLRLVPLLPRHSQPGQPLPAYAGRVHPVDVSAVPAFLEVVTAADIVHSFYAGGDYASVGMDTVNLLRSPALGRMFADGAAASPCVSLPAHVNSIEAPVPLLPAHRHVDAVTVDSSQALAGAHYVDPASHEGPRETHPALRFVRGAVNTTLWDRSTTVPSLPGAPAPPSPDGHDGTPVVTVGFVGRLVEQKRADTLIRAAARLRAAGLGPRRVRVVVVGSGSAAYEAQLRSLAQSLNASVEFHPATTNVRGVHASLDVYVHTSVWDTAGYALLEALSMSCAVVAVASNGAAIDTIDDGVSGVLFPAGDDATLAQVLARLIQQPRTRSALGAEARRAMVAKFDVERFASEYQELYAEAWRSVANKGWRRCRGLSS